MNTIEQLKVALGEPLKRNIGGQEFEFYPLPVTFLPEFFEIYKNVGSNAENLNKEGITFLTNLIVEMIKQSFPPNTDEILIKRFAMKYFPELQGILIEIHTPLTSDVRKKESLEEIKKRFRKKDDRPETPSTQTSDIQI